MAEATTTVKEAEIDDVATLLQQPGADNILLPEKEEDKPSLFTRKTVDLTFLDKPIKKEEDPEKIKAAAEAAELKKQEGIKAGILNPDGTPIVVTKDELDNLGGEEEEKDKGGRRKTDKDGLYEMTKKLIEKKLIIPFEDDKKLEDYTPEDYQELYEANDAEKARKLQEEIPGQFFKALPNKLQYAAKYVADGGQDLEKLFSVLANVERTAKLDPTTEQGSEAIVREYLQATNFGEDDDIQEEIDGWKDRGELEAKANKFKPKLDAMQEQQVAYKLQEQEELNKQRHDNAQVYMKNVFTVLEPGELNGIKLDKKIQSLIYSGLTQPNYTSQSGKQTNLLGHLLEEYQWGKETRHDLVAEALWLLADPEGYKNKLREGGKKDAVLDTVRKLKTEEAKKIASNVIDENEDSGVKPKGLKRPSASGFFKR